MSKGKIAKEEADRLMKIEGKISGSLLKSSFQFILDEKGKKGLRKVEQGMKEIGYPLVLKDISSFSWYPYAYSSLGVLTMLDVFGWKDSKVFKIGYAVPSYSVLVKLLMKYISIERLFTDGFKYWRKHFNFGEIKCSFLDKEKKIAILRLHNFKKFHILDYELIRGSLTRLIEIVTKSKKVNVEQTRSLFNNDPYDEFRITW